MSSLIRKGFIVLVCIILITLSCGCKEKKTNAKTVSTKTEFSWIICDPYSKFSGEWSQYSVLKQISDRYSISPEIEIVTKEIERKIAKIIISGNYPDAITIRLDDRNLQKLLTSTECYSFELSESICDIIPQNILEFHLDKSNNLSYLPGGFIGYSNIPLIASEGIYIRNDVFPYEELKKINNFDQLITKVKEIVPNAELIGDADIVLFGMHGMETLEHLYGISPTAVFEANDTPLPHNDELAEFLIELHKILPSGVCSFSDFSEDRFPLIYIGESSAVELWNINKGTNLYTALNLYGNSEGFLSCYSPYGTYATVIYRGKNTEAISDFMIYLMNKENSRSIMYGVRNTNWLVDTQNDQIVILKDTIQRMQRGDSYLLHNYGLSVFPYLSSQYAVFPGYATTDPIRLRDTLRDSLLLCGDPTQEPYKSNIQQYDSIMEMYFSLLKQ